ncbi:MAG: squalene synthase HpnC [Candidatus Omnitrophica bacterium]|nr:squalene synthase HpnC [Candidatus Omnitrophota bacterium]
MTATVQNAYRYCRWLTSHHYENFPVGSILIPRKLRPHVAAVYAFARTADDFADEHSDAKEALQRLSDWRGALARCAQGQADHPVFIALSDTLQKHRLPVQLFEDLLTAFERDVTVKRYVTWSDLLGEYCRYSANPVGRIVLLLFGYRDPKLHLMSDDICSALQLTNFWQDLEIDLRKNRIYLPKEEMERCGVTEEALFRRDTGENFQHLMDRAFDVTQALFARGADLPDQVSGRLRWELKATWLGGMSILARTREVHYDVFRRRPALTWQNRLRIAAEVVAG